MKKRAEKLELPMASAMHCKVKQNVPAKGKPVANPTKSRNPKACMHRRSSRVYEKAFGRDSTEKSRRSHCAEGVKFIESSQSCAQVRSHAPSNDISGCKSSSGQGVGEARRVASLAIDQSKEL